jgi:hypothetical protein
MVQDDCRLRERPRQIRQLDKLRVIQPSLEGQVQRRQPSKPGPPRRIGHLALRRVRAAAREHFTGVPGHRMADAAEAAVAGGNLRLQHAGHAVAEAQVGVPDNARTQPALPELSARTHRRRLRSAQRRRAHALLRSRASRFGDSVGFADEDKRRAGHDRAAGADERHIGAQPVRTNLSTLRSWVNPA